MSQYAKIYNDKIVTKVIRISQMEVNSGNFGDAFRWVQTSYNSNFRKNYAGIGFTYDRARDAFIAPQPFSSWTLNEDTCQWDSPVTRPTEGIDHSWDEDNLTWITFNG